MYNKFEEQIYNLLVICAAVGFWIPSFISCPVILIGFILRPDNSVFNWLEFLILLFCLAPFAFLGPIMIYRHYYLGFKGVDAYWGPILTLILGIILYPLLFFTGHLHFRILPAFFCVSSILASLLMLQRAYSDDLTRNNKIVYAVKIVFVCFSYILLMAFFYIVVHFMGMVL